MRTIAEIRFSSNYWNISYPILVEVFPVVKRKTGIFKDMHETVKQRHINVSGKGCSEMPIFKVKNIFWTLHDIKVSRLNLYSWFRFRVTRFLENLYPVTYWF